MYNHDKECIIAPDDVEAYDKTCRAVSCFICWLLHCTGCTHAVAASIYKYPFIAPCPMLITTHPTCNVMTLMPQASLNLPIQICAHVAGSIRSVFCHGHYAYSICSTAFYHVPGDMSIPDGQLGPQGDHALWWYAGSICLQGNIPKRWTWADLQQPPRLQQPLDLRHLCLCGGDSSGHSTCTVS